MLIFIVETWCWNSNSNSWFMPTAILERFFVYCWRELTVSDSALWCCSCGTRNFSSCFDLLETAGPAARSSTGQGGLLVLAHSCKVWQFFCTTGSDNHVPNWFLNLSQSWWKSLQISCCFSGNQSSTNWSQVLQGLPSRDCPAAKSHGKSLRLWVVAQKCPLLDFHSYVQPGW